MVTEQINIYVVLVHFWQIFIDFPETCFFCPQLWHALKTGKGLQILAISLQEASDAFVTEEVIPTC